MRYIYYYLFAALLCHQISLNAQNQMQLLGSKFYADGLSSLWGYTDPDDNREYALVGVKSGTSIVDITDPSNPTELFFVPDNFNVWREIKTWQHYAYVVDEVDGGVTIIDLSQLPNNIETHQFSGENRIRRVHSLWIDEHGFLYLNGFNNPDLSIPVNERGVMIFDLNTDPINPSYVNTYTANYAHDSFTRNNIMYVAEIYAGQLSIVDINDKLNPILLATQPTPNAFTHNAWLSDDSQTVFTTDERDNAVLAAYDISDLNDIKELDRYQAYPGTNTVPHNVHVLNDFVVLANYTAGVRIIDAHEPDNLIETEYYDTSPDVGGGFSGCWGVYQYLPSGNLIASDRQQGLFIMRPTFQRAAYLQGTVSDALTGAGLSGVRMSIVGTSYFDHSKFNGIYKTGAADSGTYSVLFEKYGYEPLTVTGVVLNQAQYTNLDVALQPLTPFTLQIQVNSPNGTPQPNVAVEVRNSWANNGDGVYQLSTNELGKIDIGNLYNDTYTISAYKWGLMPILPFTIAANNNDNVIPITMQYGYYDDFATDLGWTIQNIPDTLHGAWQRVTPTGTQGTSMCTFYDDISNDWGNKCYTTGDGYAPPENVDLDNGTTRLVSPTVNLSNYSSATLNFDLFYCLADGNNVIQAALNIYSANGNLLFTTNSLNLPNGTVTGWTQFEVPIDALISTTPITHFIVEASNNNNDGLVEFAIDQFEIVGNTINDIATPTAINTSLTAQPTIFEEHTNIIFTPNNNNNTPEIVQIYDITGKLLAQKNLLPHSTWQWGETAANGIYFVKNNEKTIKIVKE